MGTLQRHEVLPAGLEVVSRPGGAGRAAGAQARATRAPRQPRRCVDCIYRTTQAVDLYPLRLTEAATYTREDGRSVIRLRLALQAQAKIALLEVPRLRLFLHADRPLALAPVRRADRQAGGDARPGARSPWPTVPARPSPMPGLSYGRPASRPTSGCGPSRTTRSAATS